MSSPVWVETWVSLDAIEMRSDVVRLTGLEHVVNEVQGIALIDGQRDVSGLEALLGGWHRKGADGHGKGESEELHFD